MKENPKLAEEYRAEWAKYDLSLKELQRAEDGGDYSRLEPLLLSVETARLNYNAARDRLAAGMLGVDLDALPPVAEDYRIRGTAQLLWELSGKPQGTEEFDWLRAERIVRNAGAETGHA
jgi:hypothetical protein